MYDPYAPRNSTTYKQLLDDGSQQSISLSSRPVSSLSEKDEDHPLLDQPGHRPTGCIEQADDDIFPEQSNGRHEDHRLSNDIEQHPIKTFAEHDCQPTTEHLCNGAKGLQLADGSGNHHPDAILQQAYLSMLAQSIGREKFPPHITKKRQRMRLMKRCSHLATDWWLWELCATMTSLISFLAIILILRLHEGRPLPDRPFSITINSLVSIFATIMKAAMLVPIAEGISQSKWLWFQQHHALQDIEIYDRASRGPWGALKMVFNIKWRHISSLGALVTMLALAMDPIVQQAIVNQPEQVASFRNASLPVRHVYAGDIGFMIEGATLTGLFGSGNSTLSPDCPSGNCTWEQYQTLAVCSRCVDVADLIEYTFSNKSVQYCDVESFVGANGNLDSDGCHWRLPNGLNKSMNLWSQGAITSGSLSAMKLANIGNTLTNFSILTPGYPDYAAATECSLYWCTNTYKATVTSAEFNEELVDSWSNKSSPLMLDTNFTAYGGVPTPFYDVTPPYTVPGLPNANLSSLLISDPFAQEGFFVEAGSGEDIYEYLGQLLSTNGSYSLRNQGVDEINNLLAQNTDQLFTIFERLAQHLSIAIRTAEGIATVDPGMSQVMGTMWTNETIMRVRWRWLSFPLALWVVSCTFLCTTIRGTARGKLGAWKSSTLALLYHGLDDYNNGSLDGSNRIAEMQKAAGKTWVRLEDDGKGWKLVGRNE